jgi:signal peptidase I
MKAEALRRFAREEPIEVRVRGRCMEPLLAEGSRVQVAPARVYWPGDVLVFRAPDGGLLAHRLLGCRRHGGAWALVTRGDSCSTHDSPVPPARVVGRVLGVDVPVPVRARALLSFFRLALARLVRLIRLGR